MTKAYPLDREEPPNRAAMQTAPANCRNLCPNQPGSWESQGKQRQVTRPPGKSHKEIAPHIKGGKKEEQLCNPKHISLPSVIK